MRRQGRRLQRADRRGGTQPLRRRQCLYRRHLRGPERLLDQWIPRACTFNNTDRLRRRQRLQRRRDLRPRLRLPPRRHAGLRRRQRLHDGVETCDARQLPRRDRRSPATTATPATAPRPATRPPAACTATPPLACDDGNACTADTCDRGTATAGTPLACDDGNACNGAETCDPATGAHVDTARLRRRQRLQRATLQPGHGCHAGTPPPATTATPAPPNLQRRHRLLAAHRRLQRRQRLHHRPCDPASGELPVHGLQRWHHRCDCDDGNACNGVETCDRRPAAMPAPRRPATTATPARRRLVRPRHRLPAGTPLACDDGNACNGARPATPAPAATPARRSTATTATPAPRCLRPGDGLRHATHGSPATTATPARRARPAADGDLQRR